MLTFEFLHFMLDDDFLHVVSKIPIDNLYDYSVIIMSDNTKKVGLNY